MPEETQTEEVQEAQQEEAVTPPEPVDAYAGLHPRISDPYITSQTIDSFSGADPILEFVSRAVIVEKRKSGSNKLVCRLAGDNEDIVLDFNRLSEDTIYPLRIGAIRASTTVEKVHLLA